MGFPPERPVYVLGESFGALVAIAVAAARPDLIDRLVLVNPATSFQRSVWPLLGPLLHQLPEVPPAVSFEVHGAPAFTYKGGHTMALCTPCACIAHEMKNACM
jgi:pimeloyl-ACP methyl ester carboxylesterase